MNQRLASDRAETLIPESERDCRPLEGPGLGNGATESRIIQMGTSLTHPGKGEGVFLGEQCDRTITAGGQIVRKRVVSGHTTAHGAPGVGLGNQWGHGRMMVGQLMLGGLISSSHLTAGWGKGVQTLSGLELSREFHSWIQSDQ
eukprot:2209176-Rhodomonas_salina.1